MKKLLKNVTASSEIIYNTDILFTPDEVKQLLLQIDELKNYNISLNQLDDGSVELIIGNSVYYISDRNEG